MAVVLNCSYSGAKEGFLKFRKKISRKKILRNNECRKGIIRKKIVENFF